MTDSRLSLTLSPSAGFDTRRILELAKLADQRGLAANWFAESDQADAIGLMHAAAVLTERAAVASGVIPIQTRPPALVAMGCSNLTHLAPGRVRIGIGHSSPNVVSKWSGREFVADGALGQVRDFALAFRACLSGEKTEYDGEWFKVDGFRLRLPPASPVDVIVAALGDQMALAAAEYADGVLMSYMTPERLASLAPRLKERALKSRGGADGLKICVMVNVAITDSPDEISSGYRRVLVSYSTVDAYAAVFSQAGFESQVGDVRRRWSSGDRKGALDAIDLEMVRGLTAFGDTEYVAERVLALLAAGADEVALGIVETPSTSSAQSVIEALSERI